MEGHTIDCKKCGGTLDVPEGLNSVFCAYCGTKNLVTDILEIPGLTLLCLKCNTKNKDENIHCQKCGTKLQEQCPFCEEEHPYNVVCCPKTGGNISAKLRERAEKTLEMWNKALKVTQEAIEISECTILIPEELKDKELEKISGNFNEANYTELYQIEEKSKKAYNEIITITKNSLKKELEKRRGLLMKSEHEINELERITKSNKNEALEKKEKAIEDKKNEISFKEYNLDGITKFLITIIIIFSFLPAFKIGLLLSLKTFGIVVLYIFIVIVFILLIKFISFRLKANLKKKLNLAKKYLSSEYDNSINKIEGQYNTQIIILKDKLEQAREVMNKVEKALEIGY